VDAALNDGDSSSQVTFTFSEAPVGFMAADITAVGGTVSGLAATVNPLVYTATFTANDYFDGTGSVSVATGSYTDADGNAGAGGSDSVAIDRDDLPTANPDSNSGAEASSSGKSVNITIIFDRSGSMGEDPNVNGFSERIDLARAAVANLLTGLDGAATEVHVQVVDFASTAESSGWLSIDGANAYLAGLVASGGTNYDAALTTAQAAFVNNTPAADQNITLFLSDGVPTAGQEIGMADQTIWESFLSAHDMPAFAIGIGTGVTIGPLQPIAFDPEAGTQAADTPVVYGTGGEGALINALSPLVIGSLLNSFSGDLLLNDQFGGDGAGVPEISAVSYASVSGSSLTFTVTSAPDPLAPDMTQLTGSHDGVDYWRLDVNTATGTYDLSLLQNFPHATPGGTATLTFNYTIHDFDGDSSSSTLAVAIGDVTTATIAGLSQIVGGNTADTLNGTGAAEILGGDADNDILNGNGGDDFVFGGAGTDTLTGGTGNDTLYGGAGNDTYKFDLGDGTDTISDTGGTDTIVIQTGSAALSGLNFERDDNNLVIDYGSDTITVINHFAGTNVEQIQFSGGGSVYGYSLGTYLMGVGLTGGSNADVIAGTGNGEALTGNAGNDLLFGNGGNDATISGNAGNDLLVGGSGDDTLNGGADNDWLVGGLGADNLTGSSGNDTFVYTAVDDSLSSLFDTITDFTSADKIDLTAFGTASFTNVSWDYNSTSNETTVQIDTDGNSITAGLEIHLAGNIALTQSQFIFA
jgi:Bacterial Ig-like domain/RTX calcium-binding nonapeptide repeat (4 copies)/von Willebrand factor type A domain